MFGLQPGLARLANWWQRLGGELEVAIIAAPNEVGTLEAYVAQAPRVCAGPSIATVDAEPSQIIAMRTAPEKPNTWKAPPEDQAASR